MKLIDCETNNLKLHVAPIIRDSPSDQWTEAHAKKLVPDNLYEFYVAADFFSFGACPLFLKDNENIIFAHIEAATELIRESFVESIEIANLLKEYDVKSYNPKKDSINDADHKKAEKNFNRHLQIAIINLYSILDSSSEIVAAVLSYGMVGNATFSGLMPNDRKDAAKNKTVIGIDEQYIERIKEIIDSKLYIEECSKGWFKLFKLYRNKLAHFKISGLLKFHDKNNNFYTFLPRVWPNYLNQHLSYSSIKLNRNNGRQSILKLSMEEDVFDYLNGLRGTIFDLIDKMFYVIVEAYKVKKANNNPIEAGINKRASEMMQFSDFKHF